MAMQIRTIKHLTEEKFKKRIEVDGVMYSWLVPFCADIRNKYKGGPDGRTAYEKITGHKCRQVAIGFAEVVDYILEPMESIYGLSNLECLSFFVGVLCS